MEYLLAFLLLVGIWGLTTILSGIFGLLIPIFYLFLGFVLGVESFLLGVAGLFGNAINIYAVKKYIKEQK